jgi:rubrerythrin
MNHAQELVPAVKKDEVFSLKSDLLALYSREIFERNLYFQELRKFEGEIFETIKWLSEQEENHVHIIENILNKANILVKENTPVLPRLETDTKKVIQLNISNENVSIQIYKKTIAKCSGPLKKILEEIMSEEFTHIKRLEEYT